MKAKTALTVVCPSECCFFVLWASPQFCSLGRNLLSLSEIRKIARNRVTVRLRPEPVKFRGVDSTHGKQVDVWNPRAKWYLWTVDSDWTFTQLCWKSLSSRHGYSILTFLTSCSYKTSNSWKQQFHYSPLFSFESTQIERVGQMETNDVREGR